MIGNLIVLYYMHGNELGWMVLAEDVAGQKYPEGRPISALRGTCDTQAKVRVCRWKKLKRRATQNNATNLN